MLRKMPHHRELAELSKGADAANVKYEEYVYQGAQHGFHNDSTPRYDKASADLSWQRTIAFFNKTVKAS